MIKHLIKHYNKIWTPVFFAAAAVTYYLNCSEVICHHNHPGHGQNQSHFTEMFFMWLAMGFAHLGAWFPHCDCK